MGRMKLEDVDVVLVDTQNTLWRAAYAQGDLGIRLDDGEWMPTGGVYGSINSVLSLLREIGGLLPPTVVWCWEGKGSRAVRRAIDPGYKERPPVDEEKRHLLELVFHQADLLRSVLKRTAWLQAQTDGWEADDTIGTLAHRFANRGHNVLIYSSDRDMLQLVSDGEPSSEESEGAGSVRLYTPTGNDGGPVWNEAELLDRWGVGPELVTTVKALAGDKSDNVPGVPGVGDVWARKIAAAYGPLANILPAAAKGTLKGTWQGKDWTASSKAKAIHEHELDAKRCLDLVTIRCTVRPVVHAGENDRTALTRALHGLKCNTLASHANMRMMVFDDVVDLGDEGGEE